MEAVIVKECSALGGLFQTVIADMKSSYPIWEDFITKAGKLQSQLRVDRHCEAEHCDRRKCCRIDLRVRLHCTSTHRLVQGWTKSGEFAQGQKRGCWDVPLCHPWTRDNQICPCGSDGSVRSQECDTVHKTGKRCQWEFSDLHLQL